MRDVLGTHGTTLPVPRYNAREGDTQPNSRVTGYPLLRQHSFSLIGIVRLTFAFSRGGVMIAPAAVGCNALLGRGPSPPNGAVRQQMPA
jgi:hypothetical protein